MGVDQEWADRAREFMQRARAVIRNSRSADAGEMLRTVYSRERTVAEVTVPPNVAYRQEMCRRMMVPAPVARRVTQLLQRLQCEDGTCSIAKEMQEVCPDPECQHGIGFMHQVEHMSRCGNRRTRRIDKGRMSSIHFCVRDILARIGQQAVGYAVSKEDRTVYVENDAGGDFSIDVAIPRNNAKNILIDVTCCDPLAKSIISRINNKTATGDRKGPGKPVGSDYQDEAAMARGMGRKYMEVRRCMPAHRQMAGRLPAGTTGAPVKTLKNQWDIIFRDFVALPSGRIGDGARGVLELLARIRRKRLGPGRSKSV